MLASWDRRPGQRRSDEGERQHRNHHRWEGYHAERRRGEAAGASWGDGLGQSGGGRLEGRPHTCRNHAPTARAPFNLTGSPAVAVPTGFASTGLPLSMQIIGKPFDEATVYRVARAYEQATAWTFTHPTLG